MIFNSVFRSQAVLALFLAIAVPSVCGAQLLDVAAPVATEPRLLPYDNSVVVSGASQSIRIRLASFDLSGVRFANTPVTLIGPELATRRLTVGSDNSFTFQAPSSGLYAFVINGPQGHVAFPVVVRYASGNLVADQTPEVTLQVFRLAPSEADRAAQAFLPATVESLADLDRVFIANGEVSPAQQYQVQLSPTGRMEGRIVSLMVPRVIRQSVEGNNLLLYKDGQVVQRAVSDQFGRFAFQGLEPGNYGIIGAGPGGYGAFGFQAVAAGEISAQLHSETETLVASAAVQSGASVLPMVLIPAPLYPAFRPTNELPVEELVDAGFAPLPGAGGFGGGGGGFGGGGGGGGFGSAGGLLGLAGLGIAAAVAASDNDDRVIVIESSPSMP